MTTISYSLAAAVCTLLFASTVRAQSADAKPGCDAVAPDTARFGADLVYRECAVDKPVKVKKKSPAPIFDAPSGTRCLSVELEYVVNAKGEVLPQSVKVLRTDSEEYGELLVRSLNRWRFEPARIGKEAVSQLVTTVESRSFADALGRTAYTAGAGSAPPVRGGFSGTPIKPAPGVAGCER